MSVGVSWDRAPARHVTSEADLFAGYRDAIVREPEVREVRSEPCACGLVIKVAFEAPAVIVQAVRAHQGNPWHRAWWTAMEEK